jgi:polyisoprenoid-binding protein YceI
MTIDHAKTPAPTAAREIALSPRRYRLDREQSSVRFRAKKLGIFTIRGTIGVVSGGFTVGERVEDSTLHAVLDAATFRTPMAKRDGHVQGSTLLDVARFPSMEFDSTEIAYTPAGWEVRGLLSVHGHVAPAVLAVTSARQDGPLIRVEATARVNRRDFGVTRQRAAASTMIDVTIEAVGVPVGASGRS